eukprot:7683-Heterococcus_DN1.PRE.3
MSVEDATGITAPLGYWDPLGFSKNVDGVDRRWRTVEIKHGRIAMLATIGYIVPYFFKLPQFADAPAGWEALNGIPPAGLVQVNICHYIHMYTYKHRCDQLACSTPCSSCLFKASFAAMWSFCFCK